MRSHFRAASTGIVAAVSAFALVACGQSETADPDPDPSVTAEPSQDSRQVAPEVREAAQAMIDAGAVAVLVEVRAGEEVSTLALGDADLESGRTAGPAAPTRVASITKTAVATAVLRLAEDDELNLDDPIEEYLPGALGERGEVTIRQLLDHTSGLPEYFRLLVTSPEYVTEEGERVYTDEELLALALAQEWADEPGEGFNYSNTNYVVLGMLLEQITGEPADEVIEREVLDPAGMTETTIPADPAMPAGALRGYMTVDGERIDVTEIDPSLWSWGASMISTISDIGNLMSALNSGALLTEESLAQMRDLGAVGYGLGVLGGVDPCDASAPLYGQRGNGIGYNAVSLSDAVGERVVTVAWTGGAFDPATDPLLMASNTVLVAGFSEGCG